VLLAAGEILHRRAETLVLERPDVHLQTFAAQSHAGFIHAAPEHFTHARMRRHALQHGRGIATGDQKVHVADGFFPAPQAARNLDLLQPLDCAHVLHHFPRGVVGEVEQESATVFPKLSDPAQNFLFELRAHARQRAQLLVLAELFKLVDGPNLKVFKQQRDALRPQPLDLQEIESCGRELLKEFVAALATAAFIDLRQHGREALADAGNVGDLRVGIRQDIGDSLGIALDRGSAIAIAADAKSVVARDLHQIGRLVKDARVIGIFQALYSLASWFGCSIARRARTRFHARRTRARSRRGSTIAHTGHGVRRHEF